MIPASFLNYPPKFIVESLESYAKDLAINDKTNEAAAKQLKSLVVFLSRLGVEPQSNNPFSNTITFSSETKPHESTAHSIVEFFSKYKEKLFIGTVVAAVAVLSKNDLSLNTLSINESPNQLYIPSLLKLPSQISKSFTEHLTKAACLVKKTGIYTISDTSHPIWETTIDLKSNNANFIISNNTQTISSLKEISFSIESISSLAQKNKTSKVDDKVLQKITNNTQTVVDLDAFLIAGLAPDKENLTKSGRGLKKHADRAGSVFPKPLGNALQLNIQGQAVLKAILQDPQKQITHRNHPNFGKIIDIYSSNLGGVRYREDITFIGFLEP